MIRPLALALLWMTAATLPATAQVTTRFADADTSRTETEAAVARLLAEPGIHVVHFWAPWCGNSRAELEGGGWNEVVAANPDVSFTFVAIWNRGRTGGEVLARYDLPARVRTLAQPDHGPRRSQRRRTFLGLPLSWTPTTWVFRDGDTLAYALGYGEVSPALLQTLLDHTRSSWHHD